MSMFNHFNLSESEQFVFFRIPKVLMSNKEIFNISIEAKVLYGLMLDRMALSKKNNWFDSEGNIFIYFTVEDIMFKVGCGNLKAIKIMNELGHRLNKKTKTRFEQTRYYLCYEFHDTICKRKAYKPL